MEPHLAATVEATIAASPNRQRIRALADKLTGLSDELGHEKQARSDAVELKLKVFSASAYQWDVPSLSTGDNGPGGNGALGGVGARRQAAPRSDLRGGEAQASERAGVRGLPLYRVSRCSCG